MDARLIALKLSLDELGIEFSVSTIDNRIEIQKAIYLGQYAGTDIGYRFTWDQKGPFSGDLARDYHSLANDISLGDESYKTKELQAPKKKALDDVRPLMNPPDTVNLTRPYWLELIASMHYLKKIVRLSEAEAREKIEKEKSGVSQYIDAAIVELAKYPSLEY